MASITAKPRIMQWASLLLIALVVAGAATLVVKKIRKPSKAPSMQAQQLERDRKILANSHATETELSGALIRLSERGDDAAKKRTYERVGSTSSEVRKDTARALGFYLDPSSTEKLAKLVIDPDPTVRAIAVQSLGYRMTKERKPILVGVLTRQVPPATPEEKIEALSILSRDRNLPASEKMGYLDETFRLASSTENPAVVARALTAVAAVSPQDPRLNKLVASALSPKTRRLASGESREEQMAALHTLHLSCPKNRYNLLEEVLSGSDKDPMVMRSALMEIQYLKGPESLALLEKAISKKWFPETFRPNPTMFLQRIKAAHGMDLCQGKG